ncbi:hypothetical protein H9P43_000643 [Blastocladiella emersonii ATCC 22665]|nr:hypothetical protein H9P43_000643 [Blastocladiella emersonii ATCC 22665]
MARKLHLTLLAVVALLACSAAVATAKADPEPVAHANPDPVAYVVPPADRIHAAGGTGDLFTLIDGVRDVIEDVVNDVDPTTGHATLTSTATAASGNTYALDSTLLFTFTPTPDPTLTASTTTATDATTATSTLDAVDDVPIVLDPTTFEPTVAAVVASSTTTSRPATTSTAASIVRPASATSSSTTPVATPTTNPNGNSGIDANKDSHDSADTLELVFENSNTGGIANNGPLQFSFSGLGMSMSAKVTGGKKN